MTQPSDMTSSSPAGSGATAQPPSEPTLPASAPRPAGPLITVIEPDAVAPLDRLGEWLFASGARLRTVRLWKGESLPAADDLGDALVILGGQMSAHDDQAHPWLEGLRAMIRTAVAQELPTLAVCLGAQVAAEALGGTTAVPSPDGGEYGVVTVELTEAALADRVLGPVIDEAVRAAVRAGISTQDGTRLPAVVSHDDAVVGLPQGATLLASSERCPVHTWRVGRMLAFQHHPEASPARLGSWAEREAAEEMGVALPVVTDSAVSSGQDLPVEAVAAGKQARATAEEADPVAQAYGRALARELVRHARAHAARHGVQG
ncbi:type 1 glutamine amidotransferase [Actinomyces faecalis]|uniref:type 1 glutamine amidotransferase n=1 Tax=Actinomyces faecalis TaxID=2722820 RepID=UPI0015583311|nr:type 1 glutamine amidotransferase [Actinomyces faecalis]